MCLFFHKQQQKDETLFHLTEYAEHKILVPLGSRIDQLITDIRKEAPTLFYCLTNFITLEPCAEVASTKYIPVDSFDKSISADLELTAMLS